MPGVLKRDQVKFSGTRMLGETASAGSAVATESQPQARIVEQGNGMVVVEVVCECGRKIYLNCETSAS